MGLAADHDEEKTGMIDVTCLKAHRTASSMAAKKGTCAPDLLQEGWYEYEAARNL